MLTCKDASRLVSETQDRPLGIWERLGLRLHILMCVNCRRFERQIQLLRKVVRKSTSHAEQDPQGPNLTPEARERIRKALSERDEHSH